MEQPLPQPFYRKPDFPWIALLMITSVAIFAPVGTWATRFALASDQILNTVILIFFAAIALLLNHRGKLTARWEIDRFGIYLYGLAMALVAVTTILPNPFTITIALAIALAGLVRMICGAEAFPVHAPWLAAFTGMLILLVIFPLVDWPLRHMAGSTAHFLLGVLGWETRLGLVRGEDFMLLLQANEQIFHVAPECNGFSIITTSTLLALILIWPRKSPPWYGKITWLLAAGLLGFIFNQVRILGIIYLAPHFPDHYNVIHETVGLLALFITLALIWLVLQELPQRQARWSAHQA